MRSRGYELIYLTGPLDEMVLECLREQDGKPFCNVVTDDLGFETDEEKQAAEEKNIENREMLDFVKESIGESITKVCLSNKLGSQPCALSTEGGISLEMEKYFRRGPSEEMRQIRANRVLELNGEHSAFKALKSAWESDRERAAQLSRVLCTLAELMAGIEIEDPAAFAAEVSGLF